MTLEDLVLARLAATAHDSTVTVSLLQKSMQPFHATTAGPAARRAELADAISGLQRTGAIEALARNKVRLIGQGRQRAVEAFDAGAGRGASGWPALVAVNLMVHALRLPLPGPAERRRLAAAPGLRATVLKQAYELPLPAYPTLPQVRDALLWQCLIRLPEAPELGKGFDEHIGKPFTLKAVAGRLLSNLADAGDVLQPAAALARLAATAAGARGTQIGELRNAIIRRSVQVPVARSVEHEESAAGSTDALRQFADRVQEIARHCETGRFGPGKIFISHVSAAYRARYPDIDAAEFKQRLLQAHQNGMLRLARADLVQAMNSLDVRESEVEDRGDRMHFLRLT